MPSGEVIKTGTALGTNMRLEGTQGWGTTMRDDEDPLVSCPVPAPDLRVLATESHSLMNPAISPAPPPPSITSLPAVLKATETTLFQKEGSIEPSLCTSWPSGRSGAPLGGWLTHADHQPDSWMPPTPAPTPRGQVVPLLLPLCCSAFSSPTPAHREASFLAVQLAGSQSPQLG